MASLPQGHSPRPPQPASEGPAPQLHSHASGPFSGPTPPYPLLPSSPPQTQASDLSPQTNSILQVPQPPQRRGAKSPELPAPPPLAPQCTPRARVTPQGPSHLPPRSVTPKSKPAWSAQPPRPPRPLAPPSGSAPHRSACSPQNTRGSFPECPPGFPSVLLLHRDPPPRGFSHTPAQSTPTPHLPGRLHGLPP